MRRFLLCLLPVFCLGIIGVNNVIAGHTRFGPAFTVDDAGTEPKGKFEFAGWTPFVLTDSEWTLIIVQLAVTYGVIENLEVFAAPEIHKSVSGSGQYVENQDDFFGEMPFGCKYQILKQEEFFLTGKFSMKLASDSLYEKSAFFSSGADSYKMDMIASKYFGLLQVDANLGYNIFDDTPEGRSYSDEVSYGLAVTHPISKKILGVIELSGKTDRDQPSLTTDDMILDAYLGIKGWIVPKYVGGKIAAGTRLSDDSPDYMVAAGFVSYF